MAEPIAPPDPGGLSGRSVRALIDSPGQPEAVADATAHSLEETVRQAADLALQAVDLTGEALGKAVDFASDKVFQEAANVGPNIASAQPAMQGNFSWTGYIQAIGVMCLLLAALWLAVWALRKYGRFNFLPRPGSLPKDSLVMEAQMPLGPRKGLMVVRFMNRRLLLGVTEHQITFITEDKGQEEKGQDERPESDFEGMLADAANSRGTAGRSHS